ncbi:hypothetical protein [Streptomyces sp. 35G-GA-8]|uniref:hypothetical protein n=1 Tax=Streptomyces sp. 35G-GA-8 TaxID=2939434 RepID=UPI00201F63B2|nr:hypothetical protein [Streptomyces sp. 35G-GA-8]MCL7377490.1 hypothetical protein [Streptomyces sp. 35G-GA-8]
MKQTTARGYPYPECEPPVQKDASDIIQVKGLADAINADVQTLRDRISDEMAYPDCAKIFANGITTTESDFNVVYGGFSWNNRVGLWDPARGGFAIQRSGWYLVMGYVFATSTLQLHLRSRLTLNGAPRGNWQGYSRNTNGISAQAQQFFYSLHLDQGDFLTNQIRHAAPGTSITFGSRMELVRIVAG